MRTVALSTRSVVRSSVSEVTALASIALEKVGFTASEAFSLLTLVVVRVYLRPSYCVYQYKGPVCLVLFFMLEDIFRGRTLGVHFAFPIATTQQ